MSTKALWKALGDLGIQQDTNAAVHELEALEKAIRIVVHRMGLDDWDPTQPEDLRNAVQVLRKVAE